MNAGCEKEAICEICCKKIHITHKIIRIEKILETVRGRQSHVTKVLQNSESWHTLTTLERRVKEYFIKI